MNFRLLSTGALLAIQAWARDRNWLPLRHCRATGSRAVFELTLEWHDDI